MMLLFGIRTKGKTDTNFKPGIMRQNSGRLRLIYNNLRGDEMPCMNFFKNIMNGDAILWLVCWCFVFNIQKEI